MGSLDTPVFCQDEWSGFLARELERPVRVRFGRARRQVVVAREEHGTLVVRMNAVFGHAPEDVRESVARWLRSGRRARRACERLDAWIAEIEGQLVSTRRVRVRTRGEVHDLAEIEADLLAKEFVRTTFPGPRVVVTWGRRASSRARRSLQLGSYDGETGVVRLHPVLDQSAVPRWFARYVLFHELLHAALAGQGRSRGGRTAHHGPEFQRREKVYGNYERALAWQELHTPALIVSARTGKPMKVARSQSRSLTRWVQKLLF